MKYLLSPILLILMLCGCVLGQTTKPATQPTIIDLRTETDATAHLQAAIDKLPDGATAEFRGQYAISQLTIKGRKGLTLKGLDLVSSGRVPTQGVPHHAAAIVLLQDCEGITIDALSLDGQRTAAIGIGVVGGKGTVLRDVRIHQLGNATAAIQTIADTETRVDRATITDCGNIDGHNRGIWLGNVNGPDAPLGYISLRPIVRHCRIERTGTPGDGTGIAGHTIDAVIEDNFVADTGGAGIKFGGYSRGGTIRDNVLTRNAFSGIELQSTIPEGTVTGFLLERNVSAFNTMHGVYLHGVNGVRLIDNVSAGNKLRTIMVEDGAKNVRLER